MRTIAEIVKLDPGLTTRYLRLANSALVYRGKTITSVEDALMRIGMREIRRIASTVGVMDVLRIFRQKTKGRPHNGKMEVEWEMFWLHSILTARLTECLVAPYREAIGKEYLAGLLHDVGKLFLAKYFQADFESAVGYAEAKDCNFYEAERDLFDTNHAEIGWTLCERWRLHPEVSRAIRFHHEPNSRAEANRDPEDPAFEHFLGTCVHVADGLANLCKANIRGAKSVDPIDFEAVPQWKLFQSYPARMKLDLDVRAELAKAQEAIQILIV